MVTKGENYGPNFSAAVGSPATYYAMIIFIVFMWLGCAVISSAAWLAYFQKSFLLIAKDEYTQDLIAGWVYGLLWRPGGLIAEFFMLGFFKHGFMNPFKLNYPKELNVR